MISAPKEEKSTKVEEEVNMSISKPPTPKIDLSILLVDQFRALKEDQKQRVINYTMDEVMKNYVNYKYGYHGYANDYSNSKTNYSK